MSRKKPSRLSHEDALLWHRVVKTITPLKRPSNLYPPAESPEASKAAGKPCAVSADPPPPPIFVPPSKQLPELSLGSAPGLDRRSADRLKKGRMKIGARIDLHGHTQEEAYRALCAFIASSRAAGRRCVLVVTGKGSRPDGTTGVLRQSVPRWLNMAPLREKVLSFTHARPKDGGEGALYVLLKRDR